MTPEEMMQKFMEMNRFASRQSISQSLPGRALGAIAQGGASLAIAGASSAASAAPVVVRAGARALSRAGGAGVRAASAGLRAGSSAVRAASAGVRRGAALTSAVGRAAAQVPSRIVSELLRRDIDDAELTAPRPRRRDGSRDMGNREDLRSRVLRQAMAL